MKESNNVFVFNGENSTFPLGIFSTKADAIGFISLHKLNGTLTKYPIDIDIYSWSVQKGYLKIKNENQKSSKFIEKFSSAYLEHWHISDGIMGDEL